MLGQLVFNHHFNILSSFTEDMNRPSGRTLKFCIFPWLPLSYPFTLPETMEHVNIQLQPIHVHSVSIYMQLMQWFRDTCNLGFRYLTALLGQN